MDQGEVGLPPGFRFHPTDEELVGYYLAEKVADSNFTGKAIAEVDLNKCEPWDLPGKAKMGEKEWYFFCMRDRKYPTGLRTNRATEAGYWKATGKDREVFSTSTGKLVGMKKTLVFYKGRAPKGGKTNWVMHEYRLEGNVPYHHLLHNASTEDWVVCRIFKKSGGGGGSAAGKKLNATSEMVSRNTKYNVGDMGSPSLPQLLESPPTALHEFETREHLEIGESAGCGSGREHVPCFSTDIYNNSNNYNPNFRPVSYAHHRGGNALTPSESAELSDIVNIVKSSSSPAYLHNLMLGNQRFHPNIPSCSSSFGQGIESLPPPPMPHYSQLLSLPYSTSGHGNMPSDAILKSLLDQYNADIAGEGMSGSMQCKIEPTTVPSPSFGSLSPRPCNSNNILGNLRINDGAHNAAGMASDGRDPATEPMQFDCAWP